MSRILPLRALPRAGSPGAERVARFLVVGVLNTAFGYAVYAALVLLGTGAQIALAGQFALGILWNFVTHSRLVFGTRGLGRLPLYAAAYLAVWAMNALALAALMGAGLGPLVAQALLLPAVVALAYVLASAALGARRAP